MSLFRLLSRSAAMDLSSSQNAVSMDTAVLWPLRVTERLMIGDFSKVLVQLLRESKDYRQIARKMNRSVETVRIYARRLAESERRLGGRG